MNVKQGIMVAAVAATAALGLALPAYADASDDGHGVTVTAKQCKNGGGHVRRDETPAGAVLPVPPAAPLVQGYHCSGGKYSALQVRNYND